MLGIQRELSRNMVVRVRYNGLHSLHDWTQRNLNEVNLIENGFLNEFRVAQSNLRANLASGRGPTFRYFGPGSNTAPLPIILAYFDGVPEALAGNQSRYSSPLFTNAAYVNLLAPANPNPMAFVAAMATNSAPQRANAFAAGRASNLFVVNPDKLGGANLLTNFGGSTYHAGAIELNRRMSGGLLANVNYTFSKALAGVFTTLRQGPSRVVSQLNITHALKANWIYELPFGKSRPPRRLVPRRRRPDSKRRSRQSGQCPPRWHDSKRTATVRRHALRRWRQDGLVPAAGYRGEHDSRP